MSDEATVETTQEVTLNEQVGTEETDLNGSAYSFDDLDSLTETRNSQELVDDAKQFLEKGDATETAAEEGKSKVPAKDSREEKEATVEEDQAEDEVIEEIKYRQGKYGEEEQKIAEDTMFSQKVEGEEVDVSLKDLLDNYAGKVPYDKRFNELNMSKKEYETSKKEYDEEVEYINSYIGEFASKMKEGKAVEALGFLAEFAGMKPHEFKQQLIQNLAPEVDRRRALSPDQLQAEGLQEENKYLMQKREEEKTQFEQQQAYKELEQQIGQLTQSHGISEEEFDQGYAELAETNLKDQLNPELIVNYLRHKTAFTQADTIINEIAPSLSSNDMVINSVEKLIFDNPEMSKDQIGEMVREVYGKEHMKASKAVSKKIQSKSIEQPVRTLADLEDIVDFDDI